MIHAQRSRVGIATDYPLSIIPVFHSSMTKKTGQDFCPSRVCSPWEGYPLSAQEFFSQLVP
jgi:hypothetical protein